MQEEISAKMEQHIRDILNKPAITAEDYSLLAARMSELNTQEHSAMDWFLFPILVIIMSLYRGELSE